MKKCIPFNIKKAALFAGFILNSFVPSYGQELPDPLFGAQESLDIAIQISIKQIKKSKGDSSWVSEKLYYTNSAGQTDSIKVDLKSRGHFRLTGCYYPPLWIKIGKDDAKGTLFEG